MPPAPGQIEVAAFRRGVRTGINIAVASIRPMLWLWLCCGAILGWVVRDVWPL